MFTCGFFNSVSGDRKYNSKQISQMFDGLITDGVIANYGTHFAVTPVSGMQINIGSGRCWFKHVWGLNDGNTTVTLSPADISANRIDAIVIEINSDDTVRNGFIKVIPGVVGGAKPSMINTETFHQHPLAYVTVNAGVTSITASNIQVVVGTSECPFATGVLQAASVDNLFQQWDGQFTDWFTDLQTQMSGNVATNLQNQIDTNKTNITSLQTSMTNKADASIVETLNDSAVKYEVILDNYIVDQIANLTESVTTINTMKAYSRYKKIIIWGVGARGSSTNLSTARNAFHVLINGIDFNYASPLIGGTELYCGFFIQENYADIPTPYNMIGGLSISGAYYAPYTSALFLEARSISKNSNISISIRRGNGGDYNTKIFINAIGILK